MYPLFRPAVAGTPELRCGTCVLFRHPVLRSLTQLSLTDRSEDGVSAGRFIPLSARQCQPDSAQLSDILPHRTATCADTSGNICRKPILLVQPHVYKLYNTGLIALQAFFISNERHH